LLSPLQDKLKIHCRKTGELKGQLAVLDLCNRWHNFTKYSGQANSIMRIFSLKTNPNQNSNATLATQGAQKTALTKPFHN
jgi:hypothetical protein